MSERIERVEFDAVNPTDTDTSVCPSWCTRTDHASQDGCPRPTHIADFGTVRPGDSLFESVSVSINQAPGTSARVSVHVSRRGITADERMMWLDVRDAKCFAAAMDVLGHTDVGDLVRQAITTIETEVSR